MVGLLLFQSAGMGVVFSWQIASARHEMKQRIKHGVPEEDQVLLKIPLSLEEEPNDLFQRKHSREFRYKGEMYDILHQESHGDTTWYTCIHDVKESGLFKNLESKVYHLLSTSPDHRQQRNLAFYFFHQQYLIVESEASGTVYIDFDKYLVLDESELSGFLSESLRPPEHS